MLFTNMLKKAWRENSKEADMEECKIQITQSATFPRNKLFLRCFSVTPQELPGICDLTFSVFNQRSFPNLTVWLLPSVNLLSANPIKWSIIFKQFVGCCRQIVWVCFTILWGWRLKIVSATVFLVCFLSLK